MVSATTILENKKLLKPQTVEGGLLEDLYKYKNTAIFGVMKETAEHPIGDDPTYDWPAEFNTGDIPRKGGGGQCLYDDDGVPYTLGGIKAGTTYESEPIINVMHDLLHPNEGPSVSLSISPSTTLYRTGTTVESVTMTATVSKKTNKISSVIFYVGGTQVYTATKVEDGGTFTYKYETPITDNTTFKVVVADTEKQSATSTRNISFISDSYYGSLESDKEVTIENIKTLTTRLSASRTMSQSFTATYGKIIYAYPASLGALTSITDKQNNDYLAAGTYTKKTITIDDISYLLYYTTENAGYDDILQKFN